jgi:hypothetical protein
MIRFQSGESEEKLLFSIFRLKIVSCISPKFITICRTFERAQGTKFVDVKCLDSPQLIFCEHRNALS